MNLYNIYDAITEKWFGRFYHFENDNHAKRVFQRTLMTDEVMSLNPDDYTLYHVGEYDDNKGYPEGSDPRRIWSGLEAMKDLKERGAELQALQGEIAKLMQGEQDITVDTTPDPTEH